MENRAYAIAVGLFTIILGLALFSAFWWLSGSRQSLTEYLIVSDLPITGLNAEATVKFRGVEVGKVSRIYLNPAKQTSIIMRIKVAESLKLTKTAYAQIRSRGVTGLAYIDLNDETSTGPRLKAGGTIPLRSSTMDRVLERAPVLIKQFEAVLKSSSEMTATANQLLNKIDVEKLNKTLTNLERASNKLEPMVDSMTTAANNISGMTSEKRQAQLSQTLESVQKTAESAQKTADAARPLLGEFSDTAKEFKSMTQQIELSTNQLTDTLNHETLPELHQLMRSTGHDLRNFDQLIDSLQENPQSLIFGKPIAAPGPGENGFKAGP